MFALVVRAPAQVLPLGTAAPQLTLTSAAGQRVHALQAAAHHSLVVEFFDTECNICRSRAPELCGLSHDHSSDVFVAVDAAREDAAALNTYGQRYQSQPCAVALLVDPDLTVSRAYRAAVVPTVYVVDSSGNIAYAAVGSAGIDGVAATLQRLGG